MQLHLGVKVTKVDGTQKRVTLSDGAELAYDMLLVATGRKVHVDGMGLEAAGVKFSAARVEADDHLADNELHTIFLALSSLPICAVAARPIISCRLWEPSSNLRR